MKSITRHTISVIVLTLVPVAAAGSAQSPQAASAISLKQPEPVLFRYDASELKDPDFAALATALAEATPVEKWPTLEVRDKEGLLAVIDRAYDFYLPKDGSGAPGWPETVATLLRIVRQANGLTGDALQFPQTLRIPPMIVRPSRSLTPTSATWHMSADHGTHVSGLIQARGKSAAYDSDTSGFENVVDAGGWTAVTLKKLGFGNTAAFSLSLPPAQAAFLESRNIGTRVPHDLIALELLQSTQCVEAFPPSPYSNLAKLRLSAHVQRMVQAATQKPLTLIDYGFGQGHGTQVRRVIDRVLDELGLTDSVAPALRKAIVSFELRPPQPIADSPLLGAIAAYAARVQATNPQVSNERASASAWYLDRDQPPPDATVVPIAPFALQAAIDHSLQGGSWLNMSWRGDGARPMMPEGLDRLIREKNVFVVAAAGNEPRDLERNVVPQDKSSQFAEFVNVTHGTAAAAICGTRTTESGASVQFLAEGRTVDATGGRISGSSFAAPLVSVAAWLKHLIDGTAADRMREQLVTASSYFPALQARSVDVKGIFDPAKLLARPGLHYVDASTNSVVQLRQMALDLGTCGKFSSTGTNEPVNDLVIYARGDGHEVRVRTASRQFPHYRHSDPCVLSRLHFAATAISGASTSATNPQEFVQRVRQLQF
jgi:subtilisin family serine protease